ncbi:DUF6328 family protein [Massilia glaciei]|uniref:Sodium:proton antiporter n=1 Tax=Massilia glaciei TaxID=1524097 RepID=A0A2U2I751_9BURK|nr:DUF6328 family protein [Massilia glaciei]PWF55576.1 hypothetical protein C7C56_001265 [Massilia glaciei]
MPLDKQTQPTEPLAPPDLNDDGDFSDMLSELRILLPGAQMLTAFLIILPFNGGFRQIQHLEKIIFLATFVFSLASLVLLSGPAIQHRLMRPLQDRARFKRMATRQILFGALSLACSLILGTNLVISEVFGLAIGLGISGIMATLIICVWWLWPVYLKNKHGY